MIPRRVLLAALAMAAAWATAGGCLANQKQYDQLRSELAESSEALRKLQESTDGLQTVVIDQQKQIRALQQLGDKRLERLFHVERIKLGRYTGGVDLDGAEGDDGIKVYLRTIDQDGSVVKAAGDVKIQLFDLAAKPENNLVGQYNWQAEQISKRWSSGFMTYHFSFECPWPAAAPGHDQITVRVEFTDYLTGKIFDAQKLCKVRLPPAKTVKPNSPK